MEEQEQIETNGQAEPELLYHYTNQKGLLGILDSKSIWATHSHFLNDFSEHQIICNALREIVQQELKNERNENWANIFSRLLRTRQEEEVFVSSFSKGSEGDSLAMWRGYASDTCGYSIGFYPVTLKTLASSFIPIGERGYGALGECFYVDPENSDFRSNLKRIIEKMLPNFVNPPETSSEYDWYNPNSVIMQIPMEIGECANILAGSAACGKHIGFQEEKEWRIVLIDEKDCLTNRTKFHHGKSMLIPHVEISWADREMPNPIRRIVVGPTPNKDVAVKAIEMLLAGKGLEERIDEPSEGIRVVPSKIPYRNW